MRSVRINFSKSGQAIYISHLDINRMMLRAVRRAELPIWYTEGFNPHPYLSFALPLSLGQSSECEFMDIKIEENITDSEIKAKLDNVLPSGFNIIAIGDPVGDPKEIVSAEYYVKLVFSDSKEADIFSEKAQTLLSGDILSAQKPGKKGHKKVMKEINILDYIKNYSISSFNNILNFKLILSAGNKENLNPSLLFSTIEDSTGISFNQCYILRKKLILENGRPLSCKSF